MPVGRNFLMTLGLVLQGMTGFPWIDAIMRQLRTEGWIHNLGRRAVGSFLTRGCLWINWEEGFRVSFIEWNSRII